MNIAAPKRVNNTKKVINKYTNPVDISIATLSNCKDKKLSHMLPVLRAKLYESIMQSSTLSSAQIKSILLTEDLSHHEFLNMIDGDSLQIDILNDFLKVNEITPLDYISFCDDERLISLALRLIHKP